MCPKTLSDLKVPASNLENNLASFETDAVPSRRNIAERDGKIISKY